MFKYILTKKETIYWHRKMWNWIAQTSIQEERCVTKEEALSHFGLDVLSRPWCKCFCCEYTRYAGGNSCRFCPIKWGGDGLCYHAEYAMWQLCFRFSNYVQAAFWAYTIAELPEKPEPKMSDLFSGIISRLNVVIDEVPISSIVENFNSIDSSLTELSKITYGCDEEEYQKKHKKVKDRYSSNKFYANNFKKNKRRIK